MRCRFEVCCNDVSRGNLVAIRALVPNWRSGTEKMDISHDFMYARALNLYVKG